MIVITGAAGFIGSQIALEFSNMGENLLLVDHLALFKERPYLKKITSEVEIQDAASFLDKLDSYKDIEVIVHMGAITNTGERDAELLKKWNVDYSKALWNFCAKRAIPFVYASSAATYGDGSQGFTDSHVRIKSLKPLNPYGQSKQIFDMTALKNSEDNSKSPPFWYGLKFFNVYGPHEDHKARMASSIWHGFHEIKTTSQMTLFNSHNPNFKNGEQARDFIFIADILKVIGFMISKKPKSGIYNCGTGIPSTFLSLAKTLFENLKVPVKIKWIDTPFEFRAGYQYTTCAEVSKLREAGFEGSFTSLNDGVKKYLEYLK